jgi:O-antigen ligase
MGVSIFQLLYALIAALFFIIMVFTNKDKNKQYLKFVLLAFPFMTITININLIEIAVFDFITFSFLILFYTPKLSSLKLTGTYYNLFLLLCLVIVCGILLAESLTIETLCMSIKFASTTIFAKLLIDECNHEASFFYSVIDYLKITLVISFVFIGLQFIFGSDFTFEKTTNMNVVSTVVGDAIDRLPSFFQDPQNYAQFVAACSFLLLINRSQSSKMVYVNYMLLVFSILALMFSGGRAAFGGWVAGVAIIALLGKAQIRYAIFLTIVSIGLIAYNFGDSFALLNRNSDITEAYDVRYAIWIDAFNIFLDHPFFGIGLGNYSNYVSVHNPDQFFESPTEIFYFDFPESGYLKLLTEFGAIGFIAVFSYVVIPIYNGVSLFFKSRDMNLILLIAAIVSWMVGFYTVYSLADLRIRLLVMTIIILLIDRYKRGVLHEI